jgi:hypothetical protein
VCLATVHYFFPFDAFDLFPTYRKEGANGTAGYVIPGNK